MIEPATGVAIREDTGNFDAALESLAGRSDPDRAMYNQFMTSSPSGFRNRGGYSDPRLDLILENGRKATTIKARKALYHAAQQIILNDRPMIYLYHPIRYTAISTQVTGVQLGPEPAVRVEFAQLK